MSDIEYRLDDATNAPEGEGAAEEPKEEGDSGEASDEQNDEAAE